MGDEQRDGSRRIRQNRDREIDGDAAAGGSDREKDSCLDPVHGLSRRALEPPPRGTGS